MEEPPQKIEIIEEGSPEITTRPVTRAELQLVHTRFAVRFGDVACSGWDTIIDGPQPS